MLINGKSVYVIFLFVAERDSDNGSGKFTNVYVKGFLKQPQDLNNVFNKFATITSAVAMKDTRFRCLGFMNFVSSDVGASAVDNQNETSVNDDKVLYVGRAQRKGEIEEEFGVKYQHERNNRFEKLQGAHMCLKNLDDNIVDKNLEKVFSEFGTITSCKIMIDPQGMSKVIHFVVFSTSEEVTKLHKVPKYCNLMDYLLASEVCFSPWSTKDCSTSYEFCLRQS